jgi:hypothetical protein
MTKILATCAAVALTAAFAMPVPAGAAEKRADGVRNQDQTEFSSQRRYRRYYGHRYYGPRYGYYRPYRSYYNAPYYAYAPRPYYRPYYSPGVAVGVGPFGFGFGF